jgi:hypothetical protein
MTASELCQWTGCHFSGDAVLEGRLLCRDHFHHSASKKLNQYQSRLREANESDAERASLIRFVSEVISQTTLLVSRTKLLGDAQRELFLRLSRSSLQFYKRIQRDPRQDKRQPVLLSRISGKSTDQETTKTVNLSLKWACLESSLGWELGEQLRITRLDTKATALARVARLDKADAGIRKIGIEIMDADDFWTLKEKGLERKVASPFESEAYKTAR